MRRNFTLVELLVVTVIIGIIVGATVPAFTRLMTGNAVSYGLRMTTSQLNMARTEACARRKYVAVVFANHTMNDDADHAPMLDRRAFRSCYLDDSRNFDCWVPGTKWEVIPTGATISSTMSRINYNTC